MNEYGHPLAIISFSQVTMPTSCTWKVPFKGKFGAYSGGGRQRIVEPFSTQAMNHVLSWLYFSASVIMNHIIVIVGTYFRACRGAPQWIHLLAATPRDPETVAQGLLSEGKSYFIIVSNLAVSLSSRKFQA